MSERDPNGHMTQDTLQQDFRQVLVSVQALPPLLQVLKQWVPSLLERLAQEQQMLD